MLAENLIEWRENLKADAAAEGHKAGLHEGEARLLSQQLKLKFGPLDDATRKRVADADSETLLRWAANVLSADRLDDVFADT